MKNKSPEIQQLLESLQYCNDYIKVYPKRKERLVISNSKFYSLKQCVMDFILRNHKQLNIEIGDCIIQESSQMYCSSLVYIPLTYNGVLYEFHQLLDNIQSALIASNAPVMYTSIPYVRPMKQMDENIKAFANNVKLIKYFVWNHYNKTIANPELFKDKPVQYIHLVSVCNPHIVIQFDCNGAMLTYNTKVHLKYKGEYIKKSTRLCTIRKRLNEYIATREYIIKKSIKIIDK